MHLAGRRIRTMHSFKPGDIVQLSPEAAQKSKFPNRRGTVVAIGRPPSQIRVLWHETKTPRLMHFSLLRSARRETPQGEDW
jgi:hypothetical protein